MEYNMKIAITTITKDDIINLYEQIGDDLFIAGSSIDCPFDEEFSIDAKQFLSQYIDFDTDDSEKLDQFKELLSGCEWITQ
jgi:hypothetical protein